MNRQFTSFRLRGFTLIELMVVILIILVLVTLAVPGLLRYRRVALAKKCVSNIRLIQHARESYFYDHPDLTAMTAYKQVEPYLPLDATRDDMDEYNDYTCAGKYPYEFSFNLTDLATMPTCPNLKATTASTVDEYYGHYVK